MEKYTLHQAENEAADMQKKIQNEEKENYSDAEQAVETDIQKNIEYYVNQINKDSEIFENYTRPEYSGCTIDAHSLCHQFEEYNHGDDESFSFLNHPQSFDVAEELLNRHVADRTKKKSFLVRSTYRGTDIGI